MSIGRVLAVFCLAVLIATPAFAQALIQEGYTELDTVDGGNRNCRVKDLTVICGIVDSIPDLIGINPWSAYLPVPGLFTPLELFPYVNIRTRADTANKLVGAAFTNFGYANIAGFDQFGTPHYATSWLFKDIEIADPSGQGKMVVVQLSPTYTWEGGILGAGNYEGRIALALEIEDITDATSFNVGSFDLAGRDRNGDITVGLELPAAGTASYDRNADTNHFQIMLQRGRVYRVYFKAEAYAAPIATAVESAIRARWDSLGVAMATDVSEQLALHDTEIKAALAAHDMNIANRVAVHDAEIKALLEQVLVDLAEIRQLLITPQGRRPGWNNRRP